ncbi:MAG TPA: glutathione synthase [Rhodocyclaceae bacterium]
MSLDLAFWIDPPETLKPAKDSSIAMMRAAAARGHRISVIGPQGLAHVGGRVQGMARMLTLGGVGDDWCSLAAPERRPLRDFDAVLARKDPPFDIEYITSTWLLQAAEREGARVVNAPRALREHSEKLAILEFPEFTVPGLVCRDGADLQAFIDAERDTVLKPLDGMGGASVFRVRADDPNRNVIVETLGADGARTVFAQRYIPEITAGDKRILIVAGEPLPYALARVPKAGETRGNLAAGGTGIAQPLSARDREIATEVGSRLAPRGLFLIGIDVIGDWLTEINVTSPTCFVEISAQTELDVATRFIEALETHCATAR